MFNWDWSFYTQTEFPGGPPHWELFLDAWLTTFEIAIISWFIALIIGTFIGTFRTLPATNFRYKALRFIGNIWVDFFRNIPILVQMFIWLYVIPSVVPGLGFLSDHQFVLAVFGLGFFTSTRIAEQLKAGIESLDKGQREAALSLGLSTRQAYNFVLLPVAVRIIMPPLTSEAMNIVKNTAATIVLTGIYNLMTFADGVGGNNEPLILQIYATVTIAFASTALVFYVVMRIIERRLRAPGLAINGAGGAK